MKKLELNLIVEEIEEISLMYRMTEYKSAKEHYENHVGLIITEAPKSEQYNLCNYWERSKR